MIRPRWRKVFTDLWGNKARSLLVIASIAVGLIALGLISSMHDILAEDMQVGYAKVNPANILIETGYFDGDLVDQVRNLNGVKDAEGVNTFSLRVQTVPGKWSQIDLKAIQHMDQMAINKVEIVQGQWPPKDKEIVVDHSKADELHAKIGDYIDIQLPSGRVRQMKLVGTVHDQTIGTTGGGGFFLAPITAYIQYDSLAWLEQPEKMNRLYVTASSGENDMNSLRELSNQISNEIEGSGRIITNTAIRASNDHPNSIYVMAMSAVLYLLGLMVVFLSAFLITNTLSALLNQQVHQIGVMKTIGARRGQIILIYMVLIFIFSLIAFLIAVPVSAYGAYQLLQWLAGAINMDLQGFRYVSQTIYIQLFLALVVPQAAGFLPIWHGTRISAVEAMSGYSQAAPPGKKSWLDRRLARVRRLSRPQLISLRNTFRRKGRLALTLITLTLGGAIFIGTFNVQGSLSKYIGRIGRYFLADVNLSFQRPYRISEVQAVAGQVPGVRLVEGWGAARSEVVMPDGTVGESISLLAPPVDSKLVVPILLEGRWLQAGDQAAIAVSERFKELFPDLKPGDTLRLKINGKEKDLNVVGFFQLAGRSGGYLAYTTYDYLADATGQRNKATTFRVMADRTGLTLAEQEQLGKALEDHLKRQGYDVGEISEGQYITDTTSGGLNILTGFLLIMASLIALVGSIGLAGTMSMNVLERTREIGIMRAIGAPDRAITSLVIVEGLIIGLISWVLGVIASFPISTIMSNAINLSLFGATSGFTFTPTGILVWLGVVLVLSVLASVAPARNAANLTIREVLAYE